MRANLPYIIVGLLVLIFILLLKRDEAPIPPAPAPLGAPAAQSPQDSYNQFNFTIK